MNSKIYNNVRTAVLLGLLTSLILIAGQLMGGSNGLMIAVVFAAFTNFGAYFFSDQIALATMSAQQVGPEHPLHQIVARLAQRASLPMPRVYVSPMLAPNAFATGRNPKHAAVCATQGLMNMLNPDEIAGVMAHELAHVKNRDILIGSIAATIAGAISALGYMFMFTGGRNDRDGEGHPLAGLLVLLLGPLAAGLIQAAISRSREFNADTGGAEICGDPMALATALEKIHTANRRIPMNVNPAFHSMFIAEPRSTMAQIANLFQTHPPLEDRLQNLIGRPSTGRFARAA